MCANIICVLILECLDSMRLLRRTHNVSIEFNDIYRALSSDAKLGDGWLDILSHASIAYRLLLCCLLQALQQIAGVQVFTALGGSVLDTVGVHSAGLGLVLALVAAVVGSGYGLYKIDKWGRCRTNYDK